MWKFIVLVPILLVVGFFVVWTTTDIFSVDSENIYTFHRTQVGQGEHKRMVLQAPEQGIYHGAFADFGPEEDIVSAQRILDFEELVGKDIAFAYFSNNWFEGIEFPKEKVEAIASTGVTPFIRIMPRSDWYEYEPEPVYSLQKIAEGQFDQELRTWAQKAKQTQIPLLVEFGTEVNGDWFSWNARWNGKEQGAELFAAAHRHIIDVFRQEGVQNITWFFHVDAQGQPEESWNSMAEYYPGDDYIDWIGISVYGAQESGDDWESFSDVFDRAYVEFAAISKTKPLAVLEFGVHENSKKPEWVAQALQSILDGRYPRIQAISYWHSNWENNDGSMSRLRLDSSAESLQAYKQAIKNAAFITSLQFLGE